MLLQIKDVQEEEFKIENYLEKKNTKRMSGHSDQRVVYRGKANHNKLQMCLSKM